MWNHNAQIILDIGCGQKKLEGSIGIDFSPFSVADIILNLNTEKLPFDDNSVDYIYTSHCLEHLSLDGFMNMINEMYRVSKNNGQIYITVPYFTNTLNFANPFHNNQICFNEHTFRFFSSSRECNALQRIDYETPTCKDWGLRYSANSELETLKIEYLYFNEYYQLSNEEKRKLRNSSFNVVENITYWLKVIKPAPQLIEKKSQFVISHINEIEKQLEYINRQCEYLERQEQLLHKKITKVENQDNSSNKRNFKRKESLYCDEGGIIYPAVEVFWQYHNFIQQNQQKIDYYQQLIDNNQTKMAQTIG